MDKHFYFLLILIIASILIGCDRKVKTADNSVNQIVADYNTPKNELKGIEFQKFAYSNIMRDSAKHPSVRPILIKDSTTLIHIIEPILFYIWGEKVILSERPYEVHLFGDNWLAMGTLPTNCKGGTFEVVINRRTCKIIHLLHGE
jgi:hypothetical protein